MKDNKQFINSHGTKQICGKSYHLSVNFMRELHNKAIIGSIKKLNTFFKM